jgi:hypothetical protein
MSRTRKKEIRMEESTEITRTPDQTPTNGLPEPPFPLVTPLAKKLWELRQKIIASGVPLLDWDDIEREVQDRRGGVDETARDSSVSSCKRTFQ